MECMNKHVEIVNYFIGSQQRDYHKNKVESTKKSPLTFRQRFSFILIDSMLYVIGVGVCVLISDFKVAYFMTCI